MSPHARKSPLDVVVEPLEDTHLRSQNAATTHMGLYKESFELLKRSKVGLDDSMARTKEDLFLCGFPLYTIASLANGQFYVAGGGGQAKTGVPNGIVSAN